ncbi:MAG TPA: hypothetical protein PKA63_11575 [Oligoflexia bacterium]|nr:hypothetical protein [Oligoflexia bacterium]HMP49293.1 hypothetical protein [Oligoflexia bacterium]
MSDASKKLKLVEELLDIAAFQFVRRLKEKNPLINDKSIKNHLREWYANKPLGYGEPVDINKYFND